MCYQNRTTSFAIDRRNHAHTRGAAAAEPEQTASIRDFADAKAAVTSRVVGAYSLVGAAFALPRSRR
jgi:hypothetical protein